MTSTILGPSDYRPSGPDSLPLTSEAERRHLYGHELSSHELLPPRYSLREVNLLLISERVEMLRLLRGRSHPMGWSRPRLAHIARWTWSLTAVLWTLTLTAMLSGAAPIWAFSIGPACVGLVMAVVITLDGLTADPRGGPRYIRLGAPPR